MHASLRIRLLAASLLLLAASTASAQSSLLDSLPAETQDAISRVCLPIQFREGAAAYRNCVQSELELFRSGGANALGELSFDDKYAVQQACAQAGAQSSQDYQGCVSSQINALQRIKQPELDKLSEDELYVVQQSCFIAQSEQGAAKYRECLNNEVDSLLAIPAVDTSRLDSLKKNALQLRCSSQASTAVQYRQCVAIEFESIAGRAPSFVGVSTATAIAPTRTESSINTPLASNKESSLARSTAPKKVEPETIIAQQISKPIMALPRNILPPSGSNSVEQESSLAVETTQSSQLAPTKESEASNRTDQLAASTQTAAQTATQENSDDIVIAQNTAEEPALNNESTETRVISRPDLADTLKPIVTTPAPQTNIDLTVESNVESNVEQTFEDSEATSTATGTGINERLAPLWQSVKNQVESMSRTAWLIIAGVLALPAFLLGLFWLSNRAEASRQTKRSSSALADRIEPGLQTRRIRQEREAAELFGDERPGMANAVADRTSDFEEPLERPFEEPFDDHNAPTRLAVKPEQPPVAQPAQSQPAHQSSVDQQVQPEQVAAQHASDEQHLIWQSAFGRWLMKQPEEERMQSCIEFLVYWVAYGDERYQNDLRKRLFTATELSTHDQIKRWVLQQDVMAFSDVVGWMQREASLKQLDQTLALIMALLITENGITPVQNTLLRFLSDAFNLGIGRVEKRFERAFGHDLPPMPRPDKQAWWTNQSSNAAEHWDARAMANKPEREQMMARLGLQEDYDEAQVIQAFRRAARRCHPDRFTELGDRERAMAEQQFAKFEQARDKLLGVSV